MNRFYRLAWNHALGVLQVASELTKTASGGAAGKTSPGSAAPRHLCRSAEAAGFGGLALPAWASAIAVKTPQSLLVTMNV
ncbi:MAG: ESPR domain-containing protein [Acidithiobacillus sp.]